MAYRSSTRILSLLRGSCPQQQLALHHWQPFVSSQAFGTSASEVSSTASTANPGGAGVSTCPPRCIPGAEVPQGHLRSDLTSSSCHIGLNRRRDLTLRHDISLWQDGTCRSLVDVFKGKKIVVVGFPGGRICAEKHIPGYVEAAASMCNKYIDGIALVTIATESETPPSPKLKSPSSGKVTLYCDRNAGFMKLLGLDLAPPDAANQGPRCQRFAAIVDDGILVKLRVEKSPAELAVSDAPSVMKLLDTLYADL